MADDIASVRKALSLAQAMPESRLLHETRYTLAMLEAARAAGDLSVRLTGRKALSDVDRKDAAALFEQVYLYLEQAGEALARWDESLSLYPGQKHVLQVGAAVEDLKAASGSVVETARKLGIKAPFMSYTRGRIGSWTTGTFPISGQKTQYRVDVTDRIDGPGTYAVTFLYTQGMEALEFERAALSARSADGKEQEVAVDAHEGRTGAWHVKNQYTLRLKQYDPKARYVLVVRLNVSASQREPQRRTTQGDIYWQRVREK
jgi:hypothetical protein